MTEKELTRIIEEVTTFTINKFKQSNEYKNMARVTQAQVVNVNETNTIATVQLPFDRNVFYAPIETRDSISKGDNVFLLYWGDLKNAHIVFKNKQRE